MTEYPHPLDRETAEQLLSGGLATPETAAVAELLSSAAAPAQPHELAGEAAAMAAFQAAKRDPRKHRVPVRRLLVLKVSAVAALLAAGGLAFASTTGILPTPFRPAPAVSESPASPGTTSPAQLSPTPPASAAADAETPKGVAGLCKAYLEKPQEDRGKALQGKAFEELVTAAGGPGNVEAYCMALPEEKPEGKPGNSHAPSHPSRVPSNPARHTVPSPSA